MFKALEFELEQWLDRGDIAQFWWRDDDAQSTSAQLTQLLAISKRQQAPLALAVIPHGLQDSLAEVLSAHQQVSILQHGFNHQNFASADERKMELGWHRPMHDISAQLIRGYEILQVQFGKQFVPALVPPWNRIDSRMLDYLPACGFKGLSTLGPRARNEPTPGIRQVNVHVDIINWQQGRCFAGEAACVEQIVAHLRAKREGRVDADEATGIMSHHLVHDQGCWGFLEALFKFLTERENTVLLNSSAAFSV